LRLHQLLLCHRGSLLVGLIHKAMLPPDKTGSMVQICRILGVLCWLMATVASAHAVNSTQLPTYDLTQLDAPHVTSCQKLTARTPVHKQCNGAGGHSNPTARSGAGKDNDVSFSEAPHSLPTPIEPLLLSQASEKRLAIAKGRRAHFWQMFAISGRLRN
jgi:hypothetical protein